MPYKVVPFNRKDNVASELQRIIDSEAVGGYKYVNHQYSDKLRPGNAGCFGIGAQPDVTIHVGFVVFENCIFLKVAEFRQILNLRVLPKFPFYPCFQRHFF